MNVSLIIIKEEIYLLVMLFWYFDFFLFEKKRGPKALTVIIHNGIAYLLSHGKIIKDNNKILINDEL